MPTYKTAILSVLFNERVAVSAQKPLDAKSPASRDVDGR